MRKRLLRSQILDKRKDLADKTHKIYSETIINKIISSDFYSNSQIIMCFISFGDEVDTHDFINYSLEHNKKIVVPITFPDTRELKPSLLNSFDELESGFYDILTPRKDFIRFFDPKDIDLVIVPGVVFDRNGYRIGYGGGYYDRFLANLPKVPKIAISFDLQIIDKVPREYFDIPVDYIYTEKEIIQCK